MNHFKKLPLLLVALLVTFASCNDDDNSGSLYQGEIPSVEKTTIGVGEELEISYSNTDEDDFSYEIADGEEFISVIERDSMHYIKGVEPGESTLTLTNKAGDATLTITVVSEVSVDGDYYVDYQGIRYNIDLENDTASVAGDPGSEWDEAVGANYEVDFSAVDGIITIPANIYYNGKEYPVKSIEDFAFYDDSYAEGNQTIKELQFAEGSVLTTISERAFYKCAALESVNFTGCTSLTTIGEGAFEKCEQLQSVDFSACTSLTTIGEGAFAYINVVSVDFTDCESLETIGDAAFVLCLKLQSINFSACTSLTTIGKLAFEECEQLQSVDFSGCTSLTTIGIVAFGACEELQSVNFSDCKSLETIGGRAFVYCNAAFSTTLPGSGWEPTNVITKDNWKDAFSRTIN